MKPHEFLTSAYRIVIRYSRAKIFPNLASYRISTWEGSPNQLVNVVSRFLCLGYFVKEVIDWSEWTLEVQSHNSETIIPDDTVESWFEKSREGDWSMNTQSLKDIVEEILTDIDMFVKSKKNLESLIHREIHALNAHFSYDFQSDCIIISRNSRDAQSSFEDFRIEVLQNIRRKYPDRRIGMPLFLETWQSLADQISRGDKKERFLRRVSE